MKNSNFHIHTPENSNCDTIFLVPSYHDLIAAYMNPETVYEILSSTPERTFLFAVMYPAGSARGNHVLRKIYNIADIQDGICRGNHAAKEEWMKAVEQIGFKVTIHENSARKLCSMM
jgi:hypothetical protein